jgi:flavin reductase
MATERHLSAVPVSDPADTPSPMALRDVMSSFATGITVLTTAPGDHCHGMTANAFSSVSLEPPLVLVCIARTAHMHDAILHTRYFGISVLGADQEDLARYFASRKRPMGMAQFDQVEWTSGRRSGVPLLDGSLASLECEVAEVYEGGDHSIFLGIVLEADRRTGDALLFFEGEFQEAPSPQSDVEESESA